jgi:hypothetical protein
MPAKAADRLELEHADSGERPHVSPAFLLEDEASL